MDLSHSSEGIADGLARNLAIADNKPEESTGPSPTEQKPDRLDQRHLLRPQAVPAVATSSMAKIEAGIRDGDETEHVDKAANDKEASVSVEQQESREDKEVGKSEDEQKRWITRRALTRMPSLQGWSLLAVMQSAESS